MNYTLKNDNLSIAVSNLGAELQSLTATHTFEEYLWDGDSNVWSGRAPILFPIVGALKNAQTTIDGHNYDLPRHGFARHANFECIKHDSRQLRFYLQSDANSRAVYPWDFTLEVRYLLDGNRLQISYLVTHSNTTTSDNMLFSIGSHPAFCLPLNDLPIDSFSVRFSHEESLQRFWLDSAGLLAIKGEPFPLSDSKLILQNNTFDDDALVFKDVNSSAVSLWQGDTERVRVDTGGAPHLGIWAKPGAPFVCIEPWFGYSDPVDVNGNFADKPALTSLAAGETFQTDWSIQLPSV